MAYDIELNSPNLDKFNRGLDASLSKVERLAGAVNELGGSASLLASKSSISGPYSRLQSAQAKFAALTPGDSSPEARDVTLALRKAEMAAERADKFGEPLSSKPSISGPYSRLQSAQAKFAALTPGDSSPEARDVTLALRKAEMAAGRADKFGKPLSRSDALSNLFMTSRIGIGGEGFSMMPLMNKMFSPGNASALFGEAAGASISALAGPFAAAATAIAGMTVAARAYSAFVRDSAGAHYLGGGNADVTASARGIAGLAGMSGTDFAGRSVQFGDFLRSGGPGAGYFRSKGLIDRGWLQGDKTSNMLRAMDILRAEPNEDLAIRAAREAGLSDMMWMRDISRGSYERIKRGMAPVSAMERRVNANITADVEANSQSFSNNIGRPTARLLQNGMQAWNPTMMQTFYGPFLGGALDDMMREMGWNPMRLGDVANGSNGSGGRGSSPAKKLEDAAEKLADAGRTLKEGAEQIGGGGRSRGAIPGQWKFMQMEDAITGQAAKLGAFSI